MDAGSRIDHVQVISQRRSTPKMSDSNTRHAATRHAGSFSPALPPPPGIDPDWREKIETAKRVREETRQARRGKPATFDMRGRPIRVGS